MHRLGHLHFTKHTGAKHTATIIYFHGSGSKGEEMQQWVELVSRNFSFPHIKIMYPTAPIQPYTPADGHLSTVWFDRVDISPLVPEKLDSLAQIQKEVESLIKKENNAGIPNNRIVIGGFSMGGSLALHTAYRWTRDIAGVFVFSSFLNNNSIVYETLKNVSEERLPPLLQLHGNRDEMVAWQWGQQTFDELKDLGVKGEFHIMDKLDHSINRKGMAIIKDWIEKLLPGL